MIEEGVYGRNDPADEDTGVPTIRDENPDNIHPDHEKRVAEMQVENGMAGERSSPGTNNEDLPDKPRGDEQNIAKTKSDSDQVPS